MRVVVVVVVVVAEVVAEVVLRPLSSFVFELLAVGARVGVVAVVGVVGEVGGGG